ncbi:MAG: hypothetical protein CSA62_00135 [Planctomycetota bacterium]|nr:MAG: hypothetical protein CSA62_00135 [Planctomycetota bacterium]
MGPASLPASVPGLPPGTHPQALPEEGLPQDSESCVPGYLLLLVFALPLLLTLPFDPEWLDFERSRRGLLALLMAALAFATPDRLLRMPRGPLLAFACLPDLALLSLLWAGDRYSGLEEAGYWLSLALVPFLLPRGRAARQALLRGLALAVLISSLYGLAQALGWDFPAGFAAPHEPVSTLGNRNAAAEWTLLASAASLGLAPRLALPVLLFAGLYLGVNGGRAALLGWSILFGIFLVVRFRLAPRRVWPQRALLALAAIACLAPTLGFFALRSRPPALEQIGPRSHAQAQSQVSTLQVRQRLYPAVLKMAREHLLLGVGAGGFQAEFPPYRDHEEIALSMQGAGLRSTRIHTAHNDPLQLFAEFGLLGLGLCLGVLFASLRLIRQRRMPLLAAAALAAFLPLTLSRAPLFNAPAAFALIALLALSLPGPSFRTWLWQNGEFSDGESPCTPGFTKYLRIGSALMLTLLGLSLLAGSSFSAAHARQLRQGQQSLEDVAKTLRSLDLAVQYDPFEPEWRYLRVLRSRELLQQLPSEQSSKDWPAEKRAQLAALRARGSQLLPDLNLVLQRDRYHYAALYMLALLGFERSDLRQRGMAAIEELEQLHPGYPGAAAVRHAYMQLRRALLTLDDLRRAPAASKLQPGLDAIRELRRSFPGHRDLMRIDLRYALIQVDIERILTVLRQLADQSLLLETLRKIEAASAKPNQQPMRLLSLHSKLRKLGRELFPEAPEFR